MISRLSSHVTLGFLDSLVLVSLRHCKMCHNINIIHWLYLYVQGASQRPYSSNEYGRWEAPCTEGAPMVQQDSIGRPAHDS